MTQDELDALMGGDIDSLTDEMLEEDTIEAASEEIVEETSKEDDEDFPPGYNDKTAHHWPLPATDENKMVHQLDDVTKESEEKASEIFDIIEGISNDMMEKEETAAKVVEILESNVNLFTTLSEKFPEVEAFGKQLEENQKAIEIANESIEMLQNSGDAIMNVMDIMQYQDIHRQKIERVINVMRALSKYMNTLFEGKIDDERRVSSAVHIAGDENTDLASAEEIEALLAQFGNK